MLFIAFWLWLFSRLVPLSRKASRGRLFVPAALPALRTRKPDWVIDEVVRLKALMSDAGDRRIADTAYRRGNITTFKGDRRAKLTAAKFGQVTMPVCSIARFMKIGVRLLLATCSRTRPQK